MTARFGTKVGRVGIAIIKRAQSDGMVKTIGYCVTFRDEDGARAGQFELSQEMASELVKRLTGALPREPLSDTHQPRDE